MTKDKTIAQRAAEIELVELAHCDDGEIETIRRIRNEPSVRANMYTSHEIGVAEHRDWVASVSGADDLLFFAVRHGSEIVGAASFSAIDREGKTADWAFYLSQKTRGKGLGAALEHKMLGMAFDKYGFAKLGCEVLAFNEPVIALHKRFGFVEEERLTARIEREGIQHDAIRMGMTAERYRELSRDTSAG